MKIILQHLFILLFALLPSFSFSQCDTTTQVHLVVSVLTDAYPYETSWKVIDKEGIVYGMAQLDATYESGKKYEWDVCIPKGQCVTFYIYDDFGDGIEAPGHYSLELDGEGIIFSTLNAAEAKHELNCPLGQACVTAEEIGTGSHIAGVDNSWYAFTPTETGKYEITTCNQNTCDTKIWVFEECALAHNEEDNEGTLAYDDNFGACGEQASIITAFLKDQTIYIRIGDDQDDCGGVALDWELNFIGATYGCTDPESCNYNPLASIEDGSCLPNGHPDCPAAPDLLVREDVLTSSAYLSQIFVQDDCLVEEGCLNGYGNRDIIRFSTYIENIGDADYYIGSPSEFDSQFTYDNCHNHWHYDGYAEYVLFDEDGIEIPIGFKNGFCVIDLGCSTGSPQYNCVDMGITAGCYDEYWADLECQWIDITDVPDGSYTFVTRVNWDNAPDALGRVEKDTLNNWAQMCIILDRSSGSLTFTQEEDCVPFRDCNDVLFGNSQYDCAGVCDGTAKWGDLNTDGNQDQTDVLTYIATIQMGNPPAATCMDLSGEGEISVYDAALMADCAIYGEAYEPVGGGQENHCSFPHSLFNPADTAGFTIAEFNEIQHYIDIEIKSASANIVGYQFYMSGINITKVESLVDPGVYPHEPRFGANGLVFGLSTEDSTIVRSSNWQKLIRVFHDGNIDNEVCLRQVKEVVNQDYELIDHYVDVNCVTLTGLTNLNTDLAPSVQPNPFSNKTLLTFHNPESQPFVLQITDINGKALQQIKDIQRDQIMIDASDFPSGVYLYQLIGAEGLASGKLVVE